MNVQFLEDPIAVAHCCPKCNSQKVRHLLGGFSLSNQPKYLQLTPRQTLEKVGFGRCGLHTAPPVGRPTAFLSDGFGALQRHFELRDIYAQFLAKPLAFPEQVRDRCQFRALWPHVVQSTIVLTVVFVTDLTYRLGQSDVR